MRSIKLTLEYDGTAYAGWQSQSNAIAIQDIVAKAIGRMTEEKVHLRGASRTDAGVHALGQVACFSTARAIPCDGFLRGLNTLLPEDIRVVGCEEVEEKFHPIRNAKRKTYQYRLLLSEVESALWRHRAWTVSPKLDIAAMKKAARFLVGEHDFKSFQGAPSSVKTTVRRMESIVLDGPSPQPSLQRGEGDCRVPSPRWGEGGRRPGEGFLTITFIAPGFLKYMVRNIVGTLVDVGSGKIVPEKVKEILEVKDRKKAGSIAPPQGLYLVKVEY